MSETATVTVLIPARNEEADIELCLRAVLAQDHPHDWMEIVLVDGGSTDRTAEVAAAVLSDGDIDWRIVQNPVGTTPSNLNAGLEFAAGLYVCRVDARSLIPGDYVRRCSEVLENRPDVAVVGGTQLAHARTPGVHDVGIARALNNRYAMGGARYRSGADSGPADTVYLGAFRTDELREAGGWDEIMLTNQDFELNRRMASRGVVWLESGLPVGYVPRRALADLWRQYRRFGRWKVRYWRRTGDRPQRRQLAALVGAPVALGGSLCVAISGHGRRRLVTAAALGAVAVAVEDRGCRGPQGGPASRSLAVLTICTVAAGWISGVLEELLAGER